MEIPDFVEELELALGITAVKRFLPIQEGDVPKTASDTSALEKWIGFKPKTTISYGIHKFISWYRQYYNI